MTHSTLTQIEQAIERMKVEVDALCLCGAHEAAVALLAQVARRTERAAAFGDTAIGAADVTLSIQRRANNVITGRKRRVH